ncbi:hypothetical protein APHAL10511_002672 [Amanita phalloides]|nr:hypothetical protein APHAL10511_002672 [Amanita phalloides]
MPTSTLRQRNPFLFADEDDSGVLDEQEQEEVIHQLKARAKATNTQYILAAWLLLSLSAAL